MNTAVAFILGLMLVGFLFIQVPRLFARGALSLRVARALREEKRNRRPAGNAVSAYHDAVTTGATRAALDARTWRDLDLDDVFQHADYTASRPGQQYLYHLLQTPQFERQPLEALGASVNGFRADAAASERCRDALRKVDDPRASFLVELLFQNLPKRPRCWWLFPLMTLASVTAVALMFVWPQSILAVIALCAVNVVTQVRYRPRVEALIPAIHEVPAFLNAARALGNMSLAVCESQLDTLRDGERLLGMLRRATRWLSFEPSQTSNEFLTTLYAYANLLLLIDVNAFVLGISAARTAQPQLQQMFAAMGHIDAAQSISRWRETLPSWSEPNFTAARKALDVSGVYHPLVSKAVPNDLSVAEASVLITGSNMSGKTTFVRAMGVNAVLAQTLFTACAGVWQTPFFSVNASIGRTDSILEGKSYYLAEVESVRDLIRAKGDRHQHLFLLDEIYRGTNTNERVAAAYAVLEHLNEAADIVIVATHDVELLGMLGATYASRHFREHIANGALTFDFIMRPGQATTRNAIALLELMDYPAHVVTVARRAVGERSRTDDTAGERPACDSAVADTTS